MRLLDELNYEEMDWITASGQGTLAVEMTESFHENEKLLEIHSNIKNKLATNGIEYERNILERVDAGCNSAIAIESISENSKQIIRGEIYGVKKFITFSIKTLLSTPFGPAITGMFILSKNILSLIFIFLFFF